MTCLLVVPAGLPNQGPPYCAGSPHPPEPVTQLPHAQNTLLEVVESKLNPHRMTNSRHITRAGGCAVVLSQDKGER